MNQPPVEGSLTSATEGGGQATAEEAEAEVATKPVEASAVAAVQAAPDDKTRQRIAANAVQAATAAAVGEVANHVKKDVTAAAVHAATEAGVQATPDYRKPEVATKAVEASAVAAVQAAPDDKSRQRMAADTVQAATAAAVGEVANHVKKDVTVAVVRAATEGAVQAAPDHMRQEVRDAVADSAITDAVARGIEQGVETVLSRSLPDEFHGYVILNIESASLGKDCTFSISTKDLGRLEMTVTISTDPGPDAYLSQRLDINGNDDAKEVTFSVVPDLERALFVPLEAPAVVATSNGAADTKFHTQGAVKPDTYDGYVEIFQKNTFVAAVRFLVVVSEAGE